MSSTDYKIVIDSVNMGGDQSTSTSYSLQDTAGEIATGNASSTNYAMNAGYQQMYTSYISISSPGSNSLPSINGLTGGIATSTIPTLVITDNPAGYSLSVQASSSPALRDPAGASFADYTPSGGSPDFSFSIANSASAFGFSVVSPDVISRYDNNSSACNTGSTNTAFTCWDGFSTSSKVIAQSSASNQPNGATTTIDVEAKIGSTRVQDSGSYSATLTLTAITL
jgi:hypothetical protein